jgi:GH15 family glucan-1,4-alpha-glucosidase
LTGVSNRRPCNLCQNKFFKGLRLADKRSLPCPHRLKWLQARDELYEEIMEKAWNKEGKYFGQSFEETDVLDSAVLIMPLVFFMQAVRALQHLEIVH